MATAIAGSLVLVVPVGLALIGSGAAAAIGLVPDGDGDRRPKDGWPSADPDGDDAAVGEQPAHGDDRVGAPHDPVEPGHGPDNPSVGRAPQPRRER